MRPAVEFTVESLSAHRAPDKLARAGIPVLSAKPLSKTSIRIKVAGKDRKKAFAILHTSCYNIKDEVFLGGLRLFQLAKRAAGLLAGTAIFCGAVLFLESRVLRVKIAGSGAYYEREIMRILSEEGISAFSAFPADTGALSAKILSLSRVEFCSFELKGGVLTVDVEVGEETQREPILPLLSPATGTIEELMVLRGTPLFSVGDKVRIGEKVVDSFAFFGEEKRKVGVIARITVRYAAEKEYPMSEEEALAQAFLDFGELQDITVRKTEKGYLVGGTARSTAALGLT